MTPTWCFFLGPESKTNVSCFESLYAFFYAVNVDVLSPWVIGKKMESQILLGFREESVQKLEFLAVAASVLSLVYYLCGILIAVLDLIFFFAKAKKSKSLNAYFNHRSAKGEFEGTKTTKTSTIATPPLKTILKVISQTAFMKNKQQVTLGFSQEHQDQQKKSDFQIKELKKELDCLRQEMDTR